MFNSRFDCPETSYNTQGSNTFYHRFYRSDVIVTFLPIYPLSYDEQTMMWSDYA